MKKLIVVSLNFRYICNPTGGSSEEYWSMVGRLNQPSRVREDGPTGCKPLLSESKVRYV